MRKKLLVSMAALLAGFAIASAQEMPGSKERSAGTGLEQGSAGQTQRGESKQGQSRQRSQAQEKQTTGQVQPGQHEQKAQQGQKEHMKGQSPQRSRAKEKPERTTGQASQEQKAQPNQAQQQRGEQGKQGQAQQRSQRQHETTGQGQTGEQTTGQAPQRQQGQQAPQQSQTQQGQTQQQGQAQQGQSQAGGNVTLTAQQRTRIQRTVLASANVPRVNNVNFALSVGTVVPTSVRFVDVPSTLIEINQAWRGHQYFVVRDEIIIVDHSRKIVAVVPVGSGGASLRGGGATALNLSQDQIREIQVVLNERGFNVGRPDGHLGKRTIEGLTAFQRQQGFQATGHIDSQTVSALGLSNKMGAQGGTTSGQGGAASSQGRAQENQGEKNQPSTSGQGGASQRQTPAQQNQDANKSSTSGQSSSERGKEPSSSGQSSGAPAHKNQETGGSK